jgi:hypothetical protein
MAKPRPLRFSATEQVQPPATAALVPGSGMTFFRQRRRQPCALMPSMTLAVAASQSSADARPMINASIARRSQRADRRPR